MQKWSIELLRGIKLLKNVKNGHDMKALSARSVFSVFYGDVSAIEGSAAPVPRHRRLNA